MDGIISAIISDRKGGYYASGGFVCAGGQVVNHIAHWDGTTWSGLAGGLTADRNGVSSRALGLDKNGNLYVGGTFSRARNIPVRNIAKWTGMEWEALGEGRGTESFGVRDLALDSQDRLYAGGYFYLAGTDPPQFSTVSRWNRSTWEEIGLGFDYFVQTLAFDSQDRLVVGGPFTSVGSVYSPRIARWDGQVWQSLCTTNHIDPPNVLLVYDDIIYSGGSNIWKTQNGGCQILGGGITILPGDKPAVLALALDQKGRLVIGGQFSNIGQAEAHNIARWNGQNWESLGSGFGDGAVFSILADSSDRLIVGGVFSQAGGKVSRNLAVWKEPKYQWLPLVGR